MKNEMKKYAAIHVATLWATGHTWGVVVEGGRLTTDLLCVGCTRAQAETLAARLNERQQKAMRLERIAPALTLLLARYLPAAPARRKKAVLAAQC